MCEKHTLAVIGARFKIETLKHRLSREIFFTSQVGAPAFIRHVWHVVATYLRA